MPLPVSDRTSTDETWITRMLAVGGSLSSIPTDESPYYQANEIAKLISARKVTPEEQSRLFDIFEEMAKSGSEDKNFLVVGIFEGIADDPYGRVVCQSRLAQESRRLFDRVVSGWKQ